MHGMFTKISIHTFVIIENNHNGCHTNNYWTTDCTHSESANLRQGQNLSQKWYEIRIQISRVIQIRMCAGSLPKCSGFIIRLAGDCLRNANKSPKIPYTP